MYLEIQVLIQLSFLIQPQNILFLQKLDFVLTSFLLRQV